jgi:hypothetical protein
MRGKVQVLFVGCTSDGVRVDLAVKDVWTDTLTVRQVDSGTGKWRLHSEEFIGPTSCSFRLLRVIGFSRRRGDAHLSFILKADDALPEAWTDTIRVRVDVGCSKAPPWDFDLDIRPDHLRSGQLSAVELVPHG